MIPVISRYRDIMTPSLRRTTVGPFAHYVTAVGDSVYFLVRKGLGNDTDVMMSPDGTVLISWSSEFVEVVS